VSFSEELRAFLARKGFDPQMGARPMQRLIQDVIRKALADELLFGRLVAGGRVHIAMDPADPDRVLLEFPTDEASGSPSRSPSDPSNRDTPELVV
jgi:ATP-dependent Clp protease ATP-binding subunit ClpA